MRPSAMPRRGTAERPDVGRRPRSIGAASDQSGFTLVELLVVVLVLATLVGIAVPTFAKQRESAWDAAVSSELRTAMIALESYRSQNAGYSAVVLVPGEGDETGWGYEPSSIVEVRYEVDTDDYCLLAWYDPDASILPVEASFEQANDAAGQVWGVRSSGVVGPVDATFCD
jgi:type IV pilus assembly protein PilA